MKKLVHSAVALLAATAVAPAAHAASFLLTLNAPTIALTSVDNVFTGDLASLGLTHVGLGQLILSGPANITFEFMGQESGYHNTFETTTGVGDLSFTETFNHSQVKNHFAGGPDGPPILIGTKSFVGLVNLPLNFTNAVTNVDAAPLSLEFGTLLGSTGVSGNQFDLGSVIYLAYDDQNAGPGDDDNHDDMIIRATLSPVPEPATWAFMLVGFGAVGYALRRRPTSKMAQAV